MYRTFSFSIAIPAVITIAITLLSACDTTESGDGAIQDSTLRNLAALNDLQIGAAVGTGLPSQDARYAAVLSRQFNLLTPENAMKFGALHPTRQHFDFDQADALVNFAEQRDMGVRGHTLIWHSQLPGWLTRRSWSRTQLIDIMRTHIGTVMEHYAGRVEAWDVVNEAVADDGSLRQTIWLETIGPEYIALAFQLAHEADTSAQLFYNDYNTEGLGSKSDAVYDLVQGLVDDGVPIDGVGLQMHLTLQNPPSASDVAANMERLGELGLDVHVTEMDVRMRLPATNSKLTAQAGVYRRMMNVCLDAGNCPAFVTWGFTDQYSWIPSAYDGQGAALLYDEEYEPKPAHDALQNVLLDRAGSDS